ncbi:MAG: tetratricopeptide repeat protein [Hyphomicrobiales bacterium]
MKRHLLQAIILFGSLSFFHSCGTDKEKAFDYIDEGCKYFYSGRYEPAIKNFESALNEWPDSYEAHYYLGMTLFHLKSYDDSFKHLNRSIEINKNFGKAYYSRGIMNRILKKEDDACKDFLKAKELGIPMAEERLKRCR